MSNEHLTIAQFAAAADVGVETVRFYHRRKLLPLPRTPDGAKVRRYGQSDLERLRFIRRAQQLGFSLDEVRALLALDSEQNCDVARSLAEQKLADVELRLRDLRALQRQLRLIIHSCRAAGGTPVRCPMIDTLGRNESH